MSLILNLPKATSPSEVILGAYSRSIKMGTQTYYAELTFRKDKHVIWVSSEHILSSKEMQLKYQMLGSIIRIYEDRPNQKEAFYHCYHLDGLLHLSSLADNFSSRWITLNGVWAKKSFS